VLGVLGVGGFSVVYLVFSHETEVAYALKTLRDRFLEDRETREQFRKEAKLWVDLEHHPYVVSAHFIEELAGRLYIGMEYVEPNDEGMNSLEGYLAQKPPDLAQALRWGVQFCHGMEYAASKGIRCHRDIKPANLMISRDGTLKITDFGFADVIDRSRVRAIGDGFVRRRRHTEGPSGFGTPNYMPPEQFLNAAYCDARSDIYSAGVVLYQMASHGRVPFVPDRQARKPGDGPPSLWAEMHWLHTHAPVPHLASPLYPIILKCLQKEPAARYQTFRELRADLEPLLRKSGDEVVVPERTRELEVWELYNKAFSLSSLGHYEEAIAAYDRVLAIDRDHSDAWNNRGVCCSKIGRLEDALTCYSYAVRTQRHNASAWSNRGNVLSALGRYAEALVSLNRAVSIDSLNEGAWLNKAMVEDRLGLAKEAAASYRKFIELKPAAYAEHLAHARRRLAELEPRRAKR
jgi:serine/threonine protein kinase